MRINYVIKTDQWRSAPLRILSCMSLQNYVTDSREDVVDDKHT